jgi:tRNA (guanine6-N2)-methyltransferase
MSFGPAFLPFFAVTTVGLETVSVEEIALLPGVQIGSISYRCISGTCAGSLEPLLTLRTVDDVFLEVATWTDIGRPRSSLERLRQLSARLELRDAASYCAHLRSIGTPPTFSVTASFVGKRNFTSEEIKSVLAEEIEERHGWAYRQDDRAADLNVRVFLVHEAARVGVRIGKTALHDRWYQLAHVPGAIKPSAAAALALLGHVTPGMKVLDPCCGSGTILIEAALQGALASGGDNSPDALAAARTNIAAAGVDVRLHAWDARALPLADTSVDRIICNLPWGREVQVEGTRAALYQRIIEEMRRVLAPNGRIVLLTNAPDEVDTHRLQVVQQLEISLFGQRPSILVAIADK